MTAETAVVVLTRDGGEHLFRSLDALFSGKSPDGGVEIVLVDNASTDGTPAEAKRRFPGLRVVSLEKNHGFAGGVAHGTTATDAEVVVLVNDDAVADEDAVACLVDALRAAPAETVAAAGLLLEADGGRIDFAEGLVTFDGHAFSRGAGRPVSELTARRGDARLFPCGGFCAVKRRDFLELGGFDGDFFAYLEDVDFGWRASVAGRATLFVPDARVRHLAGATGRRLGLERRGVLFESNAFACVFKNLGDDALRGLLAPILATFQHRALRALVASGEARVALADEFGAGRLPGATPDLRAPLRASTFSSLVARLSGIRAPRIRPDDGGPGRPFLVDRPSARMWLSAWRRIVAWWPLLAERRVEAQALRRVPDSALFERFPLHLVPTYDGDGELFESAFFRTLLPEEPRLVPLSLEEVGVA